MKVKVNPGDLVRVVAPAWKGEQENLQLIKEYIESLGLVAEITENIYNQDDPLYSNTDEFRGQDLVSAITNDNCKVIWCIRGGSGATKLLRYLDEHLPAEPPTPKLLIGYSEITFLHLYLQKRYGWETLQGAMLEAIVDGTYDQSSESVASLVSIMFNRLLVMCYPEMKRLDAGPPLEASITAPILGGNLTITETSIGTSWQIIQDNSILFFEDIWVDASFIERKLEHLRQAGILTNVKAIIFGDFTDTDSQDLVDYVLDRFAKDPDTQMPVFRLRGIGHEPVNLPLPLNTQAEIRFLQPQGIYQLCDSSPDT